MARREFSRKTRAEVLDDLVRERLNYDAETGVIWWRHNGKEVFGLSTEGCRRVKISGKTFMAHRVAWFLHHRSWPVGIIDHINGKKDDNRISNLRIVTNRENGMNRKLTTGSKSGSLGVYWASRQKSWKASIMQGGRNIHLGYFKSKDDAIASRKAAEMRAGYSPFHGRTSNA